MSSILDALKKSEAERQRGTPPTLDSPAAFRRRPAPARRRPGWLLPALAVAALAGAWFGGLLPWPAPTAPTPAVPAGPDIAAASADGDGVDGDPAAAIEAPAAIAAAPVPAEAPPAAPAPTPDGSEAPSVPSRGFYGGRGGNPGDAPGSPATDAGGPGAVPPVQPVQPAAPVAAAAAPADPTAAAADPEIAALPPTDSAPSIHDLPFALRRELPELKVTMHMYSADPQRRFVLLNGIRARDGDALEGGLEVVEIRASDIVLRFQGNEFVLPLRG